MSRWIARFHLVLLSVGVLAMLLCAGCNAPEFNRQNYETVYAGQPAQEVQRKLGQPERAAPDHWDYVNRRPTHYEARIWLRDGLVVKKEWFERRELFKDGE